jgi:hypothetical protein
MAFKFRLIFSAFVLLACIIILPYCHTQEKKTLGCHSFLNTEEFKKLSRADQVLKCASCHKAEFDNEMKGPHANAYKMLLLHKAFVNSDRYECSFWTRHVNIDFKDCMTCHTPANLFQTVLYDKENNTDALVKRLLVKAPAPKKRDDTTSRVTSIDCISCHYDGNDMKSLKHINSPFDANADSQTVAVIAKNNLVCYPCHNDEINTINARLAINYTGTTQCTSCHQEYDKTGKGTHYFYWRHDPKEKTNKTLIHLMDDFHLNILNDKPTGEITWVNTTIPHNMSPIIELLLKCEVLDKDSHLLGAKTIRINRKSEFDTLMYAQLDSNYLYGIQGDAASLTGTAAKYTLPIKKTRQPDMFKISLFQKAQYWFPDSLAVLTAVKIYPVKTKPALPAQ